MLAFLLGLAALALLLGTARGFERADVRTLRTLALWVAALGVLALLGLLLVTGRLPAAVGVVSLAAPFAVSLWREGAARRPAAGTGPRMSRAEALSVLGLRESASEAEIQAAWRRMMRAAHPDSGGSDWLAARVNEARNVLLGGRGRRH